MRFAETVAHIVPTGSVWQVTWTHPKFGNPLVSYSYNDQGFIYARTPCRIVEENRRALIAQRVRCFHYLHVHALSDLLALYELGILACASSDRKLSVLTFKSLSILAYFYLEPIIDDMMHQQFTSRSRMANVLGYCVQKERCYKLLIIHLPSMYCLY